MPSKPKRKLQKPMPAAASAPLLFTGTTKRVAYSVLAVLACCVAAAFLLSWRFQFNSDDVLTGLMGRSILNRGERPLYVWSVGYQGILINAYMNALMFKLFGTGVYQLNFWPTLAYLGFISLFIKYVRDGTDDRIAIGAGLFLIISNPVICTVLLRNSPNYPETYAIGLGVFMLERSLLRHFLVDAKPPDGRAMLRFVGLGVLCGFGSYMYGQIYIFIASALAHLGCFYLRDAHASMTGRPGHWRITGCIATLPATVMFAGLWHFCRGTTPAAAFRPFLGADGIAATLRGVLLLMLLLGVEFTVRHARQVVRLVPGCIGMFAGAVLGYGPALWDIWVRRHPLVNKASMSGNLHTWLHRIWLGVQGNAWHLNMTDSPEMDTVPVRAWVALATLGVLFTFCFFVAREGRAFMGSDRGAGWFFNMGPLCILPLINIVIFGLSDAVVNTWSSRYTLSMWLFYALAFGWFFAHALTNATRGWRWAAVGLAMALLANNVRAIHRDLHAAMSEPFDGEEAVEFLRERGITRGYANYWSAYTVNFFTEEQIILQPMFSAYCPHYGAEVAGAEKIAVVDHVERLGHPESGAEIRFQGRSWVVGEYWRGKRNAVLTLEAAQAKQTAVVDGS